MINSRLITFWFDRKYDKFQRGIFPQFKVSELATYPIRAIDFSNPTNVAHHDRMVSLVERILEMHKQLPGVKTPHEKTALQRQIEATDRQIDELVYELHELTEEEIKIIEEGV